MIYKHLFIQDFESEEVLLRAELEVIEPTLIPSVGEEIFVDGKWYEVKSIVRGYITNLLTNTFKISIFVTPKTIKRKKK